jgi:hypothetical protein
MKLDSSFYALQTDAVGRIDGSNPTTRGLPVLVSLIKGHMTATATPLCHSGASQSGSAWSVLPAIQRPRLVITLLSGGE